MADRLARVERVDQPALVGGGRHELRDASRPDGRAGAGIEAAFPEDEAGEEVRRHADGGGLDGDEVADRPGPGLQRRQDGIGVAAGKLSLPRRRRRGQEERESGGELEREKADPRAGQTSRRGRASLDLTPRPASRGDAEQGGSPTGAAGQGLAPGTMLPGMPGGSDRRLGSSAGKARGRVRRAEGAGRAWEKAAFGADAGTGAPRSRRPSERVMRPAVVRTAARCSRPPSAGTRRRCRRRAASRPSRRPHRTARLGSPRCRAGRCRCRRAWTRRGR